MKNELLFNNKLILFRYLFIVLIIIGIISFIIIFDVQIIGGKNLAYSVYIYDEAGIKLPFASIEFNIDIDHFIPLYIYNKSINRNFAFRYFSIIEQTKKIWISLKVTKEQFEETVLVIYTDNAFLTHAYIINNNNKNIINKKTETIVLENSSRKTVLDFSSKLQDDEYTLYVSLAGDPGNSIKVVTYDKKKFIKAQEIIYLMIGLWFSIVVVAFLVIPRIINKTDRRKITVYIFIIFYIITYFIILFIRTGILKNNSLLLSYIEAVLIIFQVGFAFGVLKLLLISRINKEWLRFSIFCVGLFVIFVFSGYLFVAEVLSCTLMMILFMIVLFFNNNLKYISETARFYGIKLQIFCIVFSFINLMAILLNHDFSLSYRFLHYGFFTSLLIVFLNKFEQVHYYESLAIAHEIKQRAAEKYEQLEIQLKQRFAVMQGLLAKPVSEIMILLDDIAQTTMSDIIKKQSRIWKIELGHYLPQIAEMVHFDNSVNYEFVNLYRLLQNVKDYIKKNGYEINCVLSKIQDRDIVTDLETAEWLVMKAVIFLYALTGTKTVTVSISSFLNPFILDVSTKKHSDKNETLLTEINLNSTKFKILEEELHAIGKYANAEVDIFIKEDVAQISIKFIETAETVQSLSSSDFSYDEKQNPKKEVSDKRTKILIVEDDPIVLYALQRNLKKFGYEVQAVISGYSGLDYLKQYGNAELVLLSDSLLDIEWYKFIELMPNTKTKRLPVIVISSSSRHESIDSVFNAGADDFIQKPINFTELYSRIKMHLQIKTSIEKQLENQQKLAELDKLKSLAWLTAGIAHEINTPNNAVLRNIPIIRTIAERLIQELDNTEIDYNMPFAGGFTYNDVKNELPVMFNDIYMSAIQIGKIIDDLRLYIRSGNTQDLKPININNVIEYALRLLHHTIKNGTNNFVVDLQKDIPEIEGDAMKIVQVMVNLIENAIHALPDKTTRISVKTYKKNTDDKDYVVLIVEDEGIGIKDADLPFIFDPFFTTRREMGGSGLGLPVVYGIVKEHNAKILVETEIGKGTRFQIVFPVLQSEGAEDV